MIARRAIVSLLMLAAVEAPAAARQVASQDLKNLSLEQLMDIRVTVVNRQPEPVGTAAAAATVITRDEIRRSGVTTIADALALADGVHVARFNNSSWSITARGFNGTTPNAINGVVNVIARNAHHTHGTYVSAATGNEDLLHDRHPEFGTAIPRRTEFERSIRLVLTLRMPERAGSFVSLVNVYWRLRRARDNNIAKARRRGGHTEARAHFGRWARDR